MVGQTFGKLTVLAVAEPRYYGKRRNLNRFWLCECDCGERVERRGTDLKSGYSWACRSCSMKGEKNSRFKHGACKGTRRHRVETPEYRCWKTIKTRCYNLKHHEYHRYGGRGIRVCDRWLNSFENFLADMGARPPEHQINRLDNDGDYSPENCHWTTDPIQRRNKSTTKLITLDGEEQCLVDWLRILKVPKATYYWRVRHGWSEVEALSGTKLDATNK